MATDGSDWSLDGWRTYQKIAAGINATGDDVEVEIEYPYPVYGDEKEVDVVVWDNSQRYERVTLIECKFWNHPVDKEVVNGLSGYLDDSDADKGVIIAKSGFQSGAKRRAEAKGIELWKLKKLEPDKDLEENEVRYVNLVMRPTYMDIEVTDMDVELLGEPDEDMEEREAEMVFTDRNSQLYTLEKEPLGKTLTDLLTQRVNSRGAGTYSEEFNDRALLIEGNFYQLHSIDYVITASQGEEDYTMDLMEDFDLLFHNELTGAREFISIEEAAESFLENVDN